MALITTGIKSINGLITGNDLTMTVCKW